MSSFDKYVVELVSRIGDDVSKRTRETILLKIRDSLDDYERLRDSAEAQACKTAAPPQKTKGGERRRRTKRKTNSLPRPPSVPNNGVEPSAKGSTSNRKMHKRKPTAKKSNINSAASSSQPAGTAAASTAAAKKSARPHVRPMQLKDIDFLFGEQVAAQLRDLRRKPDDTSSSPGFKQGSAGSNGVREKSPMCAASAVTPSEVVESDVKNKKSRTASPQKRVSPPPLDHTAMKASDPENSPFPCADTTLPLPLSATNSYQDNFKKFRFGRQEVDEVDSSSERGAQDGDMGRRDTEEDDFIDDYEDMQRRTLQMHRTSRGAISDSSLDIDEARIASFPTTPKSQEKMKTISRVLVRHFLFSTLDDSDIAKFASIMDVEQFQAGTQILEKGQMNDTFFIVLDGEAETTVLNENGVQEVVPLVRGSTFGDLGLMYAISNDAAVVARSVVQCASLERRTYKMITSRAMEEKRRRYVDFLSSLPVFASVPLQQLEDVAERLKEDSYVEGQKLITAGVPNHWLHIVMEGNLSVMVPDEEGGGMKELGVLHRGDFAGHIEFLYNHVAVANVMAASAVVKTAKLSRSSFEFFPAEVRERMIQTIEGGETYATYRKRMDSGARPPLVTTLPFDAPPSHLRHSLQQHKSA